MRILIYIFIAIAVALIGYNFTFIDFDNLLQDDSGTALIGILCSSIVIVLMIILLMSKAIAKKANS